jgi:hypothetical protein
MKPTERQRSKARRAAGKRLERRHPYFTRDLRRLYDEDKKIDHKDKKYEARRVEWIRADLSYTYPEEYATYLKEELEKQA